MARIDALSIELQTSGKDKLAEEYGKVIENIQEITLASRLKNTDLSNQCFFINVRLCIYLIFYSVFLHNQRIYHSRLLTNQQVNPIMDLLTNQQGVMLWKHTGLNYLLV